MAKKRKVIDRGIKPRSRQLTIFDEYTAINAQVEKMKTQPKTGSANIQAEFKEIIAKTMADSGLSRFEVAGRMSDLLAQDISKYQLDAWVAESKDGHRMPAEYLPAFCMVTSRAPLELICKKLGLFIMPGDDAIRSEIQILMEQKSKVTQKLNGEINKRKAWLKKQNQGK